MNSSPAIFGLPFSILFTFTAMASEVDNISSYYSKVEDSAPAIEEYVNQALKAAASQSASCDPLDFEASILEVMSTETLLDKLLFGGAENFARFSPSVKRIETPVEKSIYFNTPLEKIGRFFKMQIVYPTVRIHGQLIGTDKLSHFFETGHELFVSNLRFPEINEQNMNALISESVAMEDGHLGFGVTGIKSYADIQAHLQGALFWHSLMNHKSGWWRCDFGKVRMTKEFSFASVVHPGWNEAINCNEFSMTEGWGTMLQYFTGPPPDYQNNVHQNINSLERLTGRRHSCPIVSQHCGVARRKMRSLIPAGLHHRIDELMGPGCR